MSAYMGESSITRNDFRKVSRIGHEDRKCNKITPRVVAKVDVGVKSWFEQHGGDFWSSRNVEWL